MNLVNGQIILASASPRRRELLHQVGLTPEIIPSQMEERITSRDPEQVVKELSKQKAEDVAALCTERKALSVVIGADTVVAVDGRILGKPGSEREALEMLRLLQNREHQVYTGVTMIFGDSKEQITFAEQTDVHVCAMSQEQMRAYVATGEPMDKAGAYGIQGYFAVYIKGIQGDYNNVVGLPVGRVCRELMARGWRLF
ncbi:septum formation inhibitor Maf [bacterium D16-54]|nr:septum formation inhibitor Maf [bacterium D16-54]RKJ10819.1 septum formation inhibitor Maf [bacterium D16-56]